MRGGTFLAAALLAGLSASGARADGAPPNLAAPTGTCDFFQAELIGVLCGHTAYVAPGGQGGEETVNRTTVAPGGGFHGHGGGTTVESWDYRNAFETLTLAVSPWQGVRLHVTGEAFQFDNSFATSAPNGIQNFIGANKTTSSGAYGGWQGIGGEATVWDTHMATPFGTVRYVVDVVGGAEFFAGGGPYAGRDVERIGWQSGAELPLGGSGYALTYLSSNLLQRYDNPSVWDVANTTRVLIANEPWGWAIGPRLESATVFAHGPDVRTGWLASWAGGEALLAPFRRTPYPVLRDVTLDVYAQHSLGQADLVPSSAGSASAYVYSATARFNFQF